MGPRAVVASLGVVLLLLTGGLMIWGFAAAVLHGAYGALPGMGWVMLAGAILILLASVAVGASK